MLSDALAPPAGTATDVEQALTRLVRAVRRPRVYERLAARAGVTVERPVFDVLCRIDELGPCRLSELAHRLGVDASTTSRQVRAAEDAVLVRRAADPADGRACLLELTAEGRRVLRRVRASRREVIEELLADWPADEQAQAAAVLWRLSGALERMAEQR